MAGYLIVLEVSLELGADAIALHQLSGLLLLRR
jgi:hypothetical protein